MQALGGKLALAKERNHKARARVTMTLGPREGEEGVRRATTNEKLLPNLRRSSHVVMYVWSVP